MKKRLLSIFMALVMVFTLLPVTVAAEDGTDIPPADGGVVENPVEPIDGDSGEEPAPVENHAVLTIVLKGDENELLEGGKFVLKNSADEVLKEWTTDDKGEFLLDYYVDGTYKLYQTTAPTHFALGEYVEFDVIVNESGAKLSLQPYNGNESATIVGTEEAVTYTVRNSRLKGNLFLTVNQKYVKNGTEVSEADWLIHPEQELHYLTVSVTPVVGASLNGVYGDAEFTDNVAVVALKDGEYADVTGLPCGAAYTVTTEGGATYTAVVSNGESVVSAENISVDATYAFGYEDRNTGFNAVWVDGNDPSAKPVGKLTVYSDEACQTAVAELTPDADGKLTWSVEEEGTYYLQETETPAGYHKNSDVIAITVTKQIVAKDGKTENRTVYTTADLDATVVEEGVVEVYADKVYTIVSTPIQPVTVSVQVAWDVPEGYTDIPESVEVQLYRDGAAYGNPVTLSAENDWKTSWSGADITDNYVWTAEQVVDPEGYSQGYISDGRAYTIVNELNYNKVTVSASVSWLNPKDYTQQPVSAKLTLYRDGVAYDTVTVSESSNWVYRWQNMPDCFDWTVDEPVVPSGYKKKITHAGNSWVIVNAHEEIPLTGDDSNVWLWAGAAGVATVGLAITLIVLLKKRKVNENQDEE